RGVGTGRWMSERASRGSEEVAVADRGIEPQPTQILGARAPREKLLEVSGIHVSYGAIEALRGITLSVGKGEVVALIGANGAGKTSTLRAVSGMLRPSRGRIVLSGTEITGVKPNLLVAQGVAHAPEGRAIFLNL